MSDIRISIKLNKDNPLHERVIAFVKSLSVDSSRQTRLMSAHMLVALNQYIDVKDGRARHVVASLVVDESPLVESAARLSRFIETASPSPAMIVPSSVADDVLPQAEIRVDSESLTPALTPDALLVDPLPPVTPPAQAPVLPSTHPVLGRSNELSADLGDVF